MFNPTWFFVGVVYAAGVAMLRRAGVELPRRVAVFFYALVFVFMYLPLTQDYTNLPVDFLRTLPPWTHTTDDHAAINNQINDITLQIVPWAHQVRESWKSLTPPLWNHLSACGYPLLASAQTSALSPLRLLGLPLNLAHAMTFEAAMKILLAMTFMFLWCRRRGCSELAAGAGAAAFGFSSFILVWLHFPLITTACLVPAVFYLIDLLAERFTYPRFVGGAAVWAAMLFGGHPETVSHAFFVATLYVAWIVFVERAVAGRARAFVLTLIGAGAVAGLLAAPLLAPFAEAVTKSKRYQDLQTNGPSPEVPFSDLASAKLLVQPQLFGELPEDKPWGPSHAESITGFAGTFGIASWLALFAHVVRRHAWRSRECFFVLATLLVLGIILSWPGLRELFHVVFHLAANARLRLFLCLLLSIQTALAIDLFARDRGSLFIGIGATAALLVSVLVTSDYSNLEHRADAMSALLPGAIALVLAAIAASFRRNHWAVLVVIVGIVGELLETSGDWNPVISNEWMYPKTPLLEKLDALLTEVPENAPFRIVANGPTFFPNSPAVYGYEDIRAHDPMANGRYIRLLSLIINYDAANYSAEWNEYEKTLIDFLNVRYVVTSPGGVLPERYQLLYDGTDGRIFENPGVLPRFFAARNIVLEFRDDFFKQQLMVTEAWSQTAYLENLELEEEKQRGDFFNPRPDDAPLAQTEILEASPTSYRLHVKAPRYSLIVSSVPWWPGWKVERNGTRIEPVRVNGGFLAFAVPDGEVDVRIWYDPWTFRFGAIIALATIAGLIAFEVRRRASATAPVAAE